MPVPLPKAAALDREFLEVRARILEIAAALDRIERGAGSVDRDARLEKIRRGLEALTVAGADRAERVQVAFSLPYEADWQTRLTVGRRI